MYQPLSPTFFEQPTLDLAQQLLGKVLVHQREDTLLAGMIVETEAYLYPDDPAAHSYRGVTPRTEVMFQGGGLLYVYFTYGMHYCCNITSSQPGEAVLLRALQPLLGQEKMAELRGYPLPKNLTNGPGKLTQAMGIVKLHNGAELTEPPLFLASNDSSVPSDVVTTTRVGISQAQDLPYRFYLRANPWVSRR